MDLTSKNIQNHVAEFKDLMNLSPINEQSIKKAVGYFAYRDACRTFTGIKEYGTAKDDAIEEIEKELCNYFGVGSASTAPKSKEGFDDEHEKLCNLWCDKFKDDDNLSRYGKAQKIINMSFKYLYCCSDAEKYRDYFKCCHMPLDSNTLGWIVKVLKIDKKKVCAWSKLQKTGDKSDGCFEENGKRYYCYDYYVERVREYLNKQNNICSPLELEFVVWEDMTQKH